jgi:hypothetical protein
MKHGTLVRGTISRDHTGKDKLGQLKKPSQHMAMQMGEHFDIVVSTQSVQPQREAFQFVWFTGRKQNSCCFREFHSLWHCGHTVLFVHTSVCHGVSGYFTSKMQSLTPHCVHILCWWFLEIPGQDEFRLFLPKIPQNRMNLVKVEPRATLWQYKGGNHIENITHTLD